MIKADIWAFGCIILDILLYCTPVFYAVNQDNQLNLINQFINSHDNSYSL